MHSIDWKRAGLAHGDPHLVAITTKSGAPLRLPPAFADVVSDMAVLEEPDADELYDDALAFELWREDTRPVHVRVWTPAPQESLRVFVLAHTGEWIRGTVIRPGTRNEPVGRIAIAPEQPIQRATSGGPVVDEWGQLVGVASLGANVGKPVDGDIGIIPLACAALPGWILKRIL
jgi:S1-C subfamily serine protease